MPRPLRIEYQDAYYHVMNRGRGRQTIFHSDDYYQAFLKTLEEAHHRFELQILCYCLMSNHYHLLVKTPQANLGRVMRHINGQYTQRHNRLKKTDGPLFRGRYKAILVEADSYQLQLSRYIHRNPIDAGMVKNLEDYPWSSYPAYVSNVSGPDWLSRQEIYGQLSAKTRRREKYRAFVEMGVDEEIAAFYGKGNQMPCLGGEGFREWAYQQRHTDEDGLGRQTLKFFRPSIDELTESVARHFKIDPDTIKTGQRGRTNENIARWLVMYLGQEICGLKLREIASYMGLKRTGSIPTTVAKLKTRLAIDKKLARALRTIRSDYDT